MTAPMLCGKSTVSGTPEAYKMHNSLQYQNEQETL